MVFFFLRLLLVFVKKRKRKEESGGALKNEKEKGEKRVVLDHNKQTLRLPIALAFFFFLPFLRNHGLCPRPLPRRRACALGPRCFAPVDLDRRRPRSCRLAARAGEQGSLMQEVSVAVGERNHLALIDLIRLASTLTPSFFPRSFSSTDRQDRCHDVSGRPLCRGKRHG